MIRRPPTMIPMTDADIQDVRALVAQQKTAHEARQKVLLKMKKLTERSSSASSDPTTTMVVEAPSSDDAATTAALFRQLAERVREQDERHRRLGIPPGKTSSS